MDLRNTPLLQSLTPFDNSGQTTGDEYPFKFIDPLKYEDPKNPLYWRNAVKGAAYRDLLREKFEEFKKNLLSSVPPPYTKQVQFDKIKFRETVENGKVRPYVDISTHVRTVSNYSVSLGEFNNSMSLTLSPGEVMAGAGLAEEGDAFPIKGALGLDQLAISENDIIMVRSRYKDSDPYELEFLGFVTDLDVVQGYGSVTSIDVTVDGVSKFLQTSQVISQRSLNNNDFIVGAEVNDPDSAISLFAHQYNDFNTKRIFESIIHDLLNYDTKIGSPKTTDSGALAYGVDTSAFLREGGLSSFQHSMFILLGLYLLATTFNEDDPYWLPGAQLLLDKPNRAYLRGGQQKVFNEMVAQGFENFYSQLQYPTQILGEIRSNALLDLFETRDGVLVCQPPRYNRLELGFLEEENLGVENTDSFFSRGGVDHYPDFEEDIVYLGASFSETADFYIKSYEFLETAATRRSDLELETHTDVQFMWGLVGTISEVPGGGYTDPNLLVKYGLRAKGPINNTNVNNHEIAYLFAPIMLGMMNAKTRTFDLKVKDSRKYEVGKLYAIPDLGIVGYLEKATLNQGFGSLSSVTLSFIGVREITQRKISDILKSDDECLNFALCYLPQPSDSEFVKGIKKKLIEKAKYILGLLSNRHQYMSIPMYKYIPSVTDLMIAIAEEPSLIRPAQNTSSESKRTEDDPNTPEFEPTTANGWFYDSGIFMNSRDVKDNGQGRWATTRAVLDAASGGDKTFEDIAYDENVIKWTNFPTNLLAYSDSFISSQWAYRELPQEEFVDTAGRQGWPVTYVKTPFRVSSVVSHQSSYKFSPYLVNKLAEMDQKLKLKGNANQLYVLDGGVYKLFGVENPVTYISALKGDSLSKLVDGSTPGVLSFGVNPRTSYLWFSNDYFVLPPKNRATGEFRLPPGHIFALTNKGTTAKITFAEVSGGNYRISKKGNLLDVTPKGKASLRAFTETSFSSAEPAGVFPAGRTFRIPIDEEVFFCSPYTDVSIERMVEYLPSQSLSGYRRKDDADKVNKGNYQEVTSGTLAHTQGRAVDLSPENVALSGGSDLAVAPGGVEKIVKLIQAGARDIQVVAPISSGKLTQFAMVTQTYIDGKDTKTVPVGLIHLEVTPAQEIANYKNKLAKLSSKPEVNSPQGA